MLALGARGRLFESGLLYGDIGVMAAHLRVEQVERIRVPYITHIVG